jgi:hypothetical protein
MNLNWFVRMARWARHPPSPTQVKILLAVLAFALALVAIEQIWGWPEWLTVNKRR